MNTQTIETIKLALQRLTIALMVLYPICAFHKIPLWGDGERYFLRILLPLALVIILCKALTKSLTSKAFIEFGKIILPWICAVVILLIWHHRGGFSSYVFIPLGAYFLYVALEDIEYPGRLLYVVSASFCIIIAVMQGFDTFSHGAFRGRGGLGGNPVMFAHACTFFVGVVLIGLLESLKQKENLSLILYYCVASAAGIWLIYSTKTRGAELAIGLFLIILLLKNIKEKNELTTFFLFVSLILLIHYCDKRFMVGIHEADAYFSGRGRLSSWGIRLQLWAISWQGFLEHPLLGWGPEALKPILDAHPEFLKTYKWLRDADFHSDYFNLLATGGCLLLGSFLLLMARLAYFARHRWGATWAVFNLMILGISNTAYRGRAVAVSFYIVYLLFLLKQSNCQPKAQKKCVVVNS